MQWETVIGLEVHIQLMTQSKIFSSTQTTYGAAPNTQANAVDIALPGTLPVMNQQALYMAVKFGLAVDAHINQRSEFARKNYFYPDSPKGYQISQFDLPIVAHGKLTIEIDDQEKVIGLTRAHLEEDAGKSLHENFDGMTGIDLNRAGIPLLEIVSEPDMRSAREAVNYLKKLHTLVKYLEICDGNMQEGSFRCDANISVRPVGQKEFGTRAEIKNINSFRFVQKAIEYEVERQTSLLEDGDKVIQETRLYDPDKDKTRPMRSKEEAHDYRYFPDPDLPTMVIKDTVIEKIRSNLPELPEAVNKRFIRQYQLSKAEADSLTQDKAVADYFEKLVNYSNKDIKSASNWLNGELMAQLKHSELDIRQIPVSPEQLGSLIKRINDNTISYKSAQILLQTLMDGGTITDIDQLIIAKNLGQISDDHKIEALIDTVFVNNPLQVQQFKDGNQKVLGFLMGKIMQASKGKANPKQVRILMQQKLNQ